MLSQKQAVYNAVQSVLAESGKSHEDFTKCELSKDERAQVISIVTTGFEQGEVELKSPQEMLSINLRTQVQELVSLTQLLRT